MFLPHIPTYPFVLNREDNFVELYSIPRKREGRSYFIGVTTLSPKEVRKLFRECEIRALEEITGIRKVEIATFANFMLDDKIQLDERLQNVL